VTIGDRSSLLLERWYFLDAGRPCAARLLADLSLLLDGSGG
jgi:hypothetical protein